MNKPTITAYSDPNDPEFVEHCNIAIRCFQEDTMIPTETEAYLIRYLMIPD